MSRFTTRRGILAATTSAAAVAALLAGPGASFASVATPLPPSTPVPIVAVDGETMSYVVNAKLANPGQTRLAEKAVVKAGGVVVQSWPQIGVVIAHSQKSTFRADVKKAGGSVVASVGATRTVPVSEGTPGGTPAAWGPGARASKMKAATKKKVNADIDSATAALAQDPREPEQWALTQIKADQAHKITEGSRKVLVGVLDSGIDPDHPDLAANIDVATSVNCSDAGRPDTSATGWAPTTSDHGTHVAGTIGAPRNGVGIVGVAPNVRMASVKVVSDDGFIYPEYAICGFVWSGMKGMDVTNNSYYVDPFMYWCGDQPDQAAAMEAVRRSVAWSTKKGVVHAAASGNATTDLSNNTTDNSSPNDAPAPVNRTINDGCLDIPAEFEGVVTVSATTRTEQLAYFSNRGLGVIDVGAPGRSILSTVVAGNGYGLKSGTSMASPHVAGVLALMKSAHPYYTPNQMIRKLRADARDVPCSAPELNSGPACVGELDDNGYYGEGIIDALKAVS